MRILVISDIHANLVALEAVLSAADEQGYDAVWCLGDLVGYGPSPNECIARVRSLPDLTCLQGNHDAAATGDLPLTSFNPEARRSIEWQRQQLSEESMAFLNERSRLEQRADFTLAHASPRQPVIEYLLDTHAAQENFAHFDSPYCLVGHTHIPVFFQLAAGASGVKLQVPTANQSYDLEPRAIINPGSVGQPRDRDPRAAFAILDNDAGQWHYHRVEYDIAAVQEQMRAARLPARHISRLSSGW